MGEDSELLRLIEVGVVHPKKWADLLHLEEKYTVHIKTCALTAMNLQRFSKKMDVRKHSSPIC